MSGGRYYNLFQNMNQVSYPLEQLGALIKDLRDDGDGERASDLVEVLEAVLSQLSQASDTWWSLEQLMNAWDYYQCGDYGEDQWLEALEEWRAAKTMEGGER